MHTQSLTTQAPMHDIRIEIDWPVLLKQRPAVLKHSELPAYLLLPEIHQLLDEITQDNVRLMINTLWHTGARISECLALTPADFALDTAQPYVSIHTLKTRGRPKKSGRHRPRLVPIADEHYLRQCQRYIRSHQVRPQERLFPITRSAVNKRLNRLVARLTHKPSIHLTPHTFRHAFAVNAILHGTPLPVLQGWLGHAHIHSTLVYTQVLSLETHHLMRRIHF